jgi:hypothetical protein
MFSSYRSCFCPSGSSRSVKSADTGAGIRFGKRAGTLAVEKMALLSKEVDDRQAGGL